MRIEWLDGHVQNMFSFPHSLGILYEVMNSALFLETTSNKFQYIKQQKFKSHCRNKSMYSFQLNYLITF